MPAQAAGDRSAGLTSAPPYVPANLSGRGKFYIVFGRTAGTHTRFERLCSPAVGRMDERVFIISPVACTDITVQATGTHKRNGRPVSGSLCRHN
ncbi:unnamed protein product [Macrosiphum euphorbiae]|uniref:Uncharacterized protein n=1 Tax=Macrosiphum euphorbiae TaxID=13131 RepID=A0AAV0VQ55_9HEMI|nr:unnamed protein product [Macrosiphum euphorbiae]